MERERILALEVDLERIDAIQSCRIETVQGALSGIRVVADPGRSDRDVVRDIVTTLLNRHGIHVPEPIVSVIQPARATDAPAANGRGGSPPRIRVGAVQLAREGDLLRASVELRDGDRSALATSDGLAIRSNQVRVVAEATLRAIRDLTAGAIAMHLEDAKRVELGGLPVVLAHVILLRQDGEQSLVGSCPAAGDRLEAAAGAVLDAVNRVLEGLRAPGEEIEYEVQEEPGE